MKKTLTSLLTCAAMLLSAVPLTASAATPIYPSGTYAVLRVADGYTLLSGVGVNQSETAAYWFRNDAAGYLVENADLLSMLPEGSPQPVRGDLLTMTADYVLYTTEKTAQNRDVYSIRSREKNKRLRYDPGEVTPIGSVYDDPRYSYYLYDGQTESAQWVADSTVTLVNFKAYTYNEYGPAGGGIVPAECADELGFDWSRIETGTWVKMLDYNGFPLFPEEQTGMQDAAVVGISEQESMTTYILSDGAALVDSPDSHPYQGEHPLQYGDMVRYRFPTTAEEDFALLEPGLMEYIAPAEIYYQGTQEFEVVSNVPCLMTLRSEDGTTCEYRYLEPIGNIREQLLLDPETIAPGEIWRFAVNHGEPMLPLEKIADAAGEVGTSRSLVVTEIGETSAIVYPFSVRTTFGILQSVSYDTPVLLSVSDMTTCLGETPQVGDILETHGVVMSQTELWGLNDGNLFAYDPEAGVDFEAPLQEGMLLRTGNIIEDNRQGEFRVSGSGYDATFLYFEEGGPGVSQYHLWYTGTGDIGARDLVTCYTFHGYPVIPISVADYETGDADNSGSIDIIDVIAVNKAVLGSAALSARAKAAIDFNGNGQADPEESLLLLKYVVGITDQLSF